MISIPTSRDMRAAAILFVGALIASCASGDAGAGEAEAIVAALRLAPGMVVADVGAGYGEWVAALAERVGEEGHVWATEVDDENLTELRELVDESVLGNVTAMLGDQDGTGLPAECCDAILLRMVYHHFVRPERMRDSLYDSLRPGGRLAVIDIVPQQAWRELPEVPDRGGHGIPPAELVEDMVARGFVLLERIDGWNGDEDRFCLVFSR